MEQLKKAQTTSQKLNWKQLLMVSSLIFGMFFGAGNLIFPLHLGQMAGENWLAAGLGFIFSGALFPLLALLAVVVTKSAGLYELTQPAGRHFAFFFLFLVQLTIGPFLATPRTAAVAYEIGVAPFVGTKHGALGMLLFSAGFFLLAYFLCTKESNLLTFIGKYLNTLFLVLLFLLFVLAFLRPMGNLHYPPDAAYTQTPFATGFLEGYNTVDTVALLAFSVTFVKSVKQLGATDDNVALITAKAGTLSLLLEALIYATLILLGSMSLGKLSASANGGILLTEIVTYYLGAFGVSAAGLLVTLGVFTTAMGLLASFANDFHNLFPQLSYRFWLRTAALTSFVIANAGLNNIIRLALPVLLFLYPLALTLTILSLVGRFFYYAPFVYRSTLYVVVVPAILDMLNQLPDTWKQGPLLRTPLAFYHTYVPLAAAGMGWVCPALLALSLSWIIYQFRLKKA